MIRCLMALVCLPALLLTLSASALDSDPVEPSSAEPARLAHKGLVLDVVRAGQRYVAVGERGHVLISSNGRDWEQADHVPVQATLTRVAYADGRLWAVGHDTAIIYSRDLGQTWEIQYFEPEWQRPLLDVHFFDADNGLAIGAYGLYMRTSDGGRSWEDHEMADLITSEAIDWEEAAEQAEAYDDTADTLEAIGEDPDDFDDYYDAETDFDRGCYEFLECHLNAFEVIDGDRFMIVAERGYGFRSTDAGETWESFRFPYPGSMFGLISLNDRGILAFGLRGNVQLSTDFGDSWEVLDSGLDSSLMGGTRGPDGRALMVGVGSARLFYDPASGRFRLNEDRLGSDFAAAIFDADGRLILAGEDGLSHE